MNRWIDRIMKYNDIAAAHRAVGDELVPESASYKIQKKKKKCSNSMAFS